jgi:hypothetical protein
MAIKLLEIPAAIIEEAIASEQAAENLSMDRELLKNPVAAAPTWLEVRDTGLRVGKHILCQRLVCYQAVASCTDRRRLTLHPPMLDA